MKNDSLEIFDVLENKLKRDYAWCVYRDDMQTLKLSDMQFFQTYREASDYRQANEPRIQEAILLLPVFNFIKNALQGNLNQLSKPVIEADSIRLDMNALKAVYIEQAMARQRAEALMSELQQWGFSENLTKHFEKILQEHTGPIVMGFKTKAGKDTMDSQLYLHAGRDNNYHIDAVTVNLKRYIEIPDLTIGGISAQSLDRMMSTMQWSKINPLGPDVMQSERDHSELVAKALSISAKLDTLSLTPEGKEIAEKLMAKYWLDTPLEGLIADPKALDKKYIIRQNFDRINDTIFSERQMHNLLCERYVSIDIVEGGKNVQPWYYCHTESGASASNIIRVAGSESVDIAKHIDRLQEDKFHSELSRDELIRLLRRGDELKMDHILDGYKRECLVSFNPFLNQMEITQVGHAIKFDQSKDQGKDLGKGKHL